MSINDMVMRDITEEKGQTAGVEMLNDGKGKIAGLYTEPGFDSKDGKRGDTAQNNEKGEKTEKQYGTNVSKFDKDSSPGNSEPKNPSPNAGGTPSVNKFGGQPVYSHAQTLAKKMADSKAIKSPEVKSKLRDQTDMPKVAPK